MWDPRNVLLNEGVDTLAAISVVVDLDRVLMVAQMNAHMIRNVIVVDVDDFGIAWCNAFGRLFVDLAH